MREEGYYWVKTNRMQLWDKWREWEIAFYNKQFDKWYCISGASYKRDCELFAINENRIMHEIEIAHKKKRFMKKEIQYIEKKCITCGETKDLSEFQIKSQKTKERKDSCRTCIVNSRRSVYTISMFQNNPNLKETYYENKRIKHTVSLSDNYVKGILRQNGFSRETIELNSELIELKRTIIKISRL